MTAMIGRRGKCVIEMAGMRSLCAPPAQPVGIIVFMSDLARPGSRALTVVLSETEWKALRDVEPDAVGWMQDRIRERLTSAGRQTVTAQPYPPGATDASSWGDDEYQ